MAYGTLNAGAITPGSGNTLTVSETVNVESSLKLAGTAITSTAAELNLLDGSSVTNATVSKAVVLDSSGNIALPNTKGISFAATADTSATGASMTSELLDDYEEGTWTPSVGGNASYTTQSGTYVKVGRMVNICLELHINVIGTGSTSIITGLPFAAEGSGRASSGAIGYFSNLAINTIALVFRVDSGGTSIQNINVTSGVTSAPEGQAIYGSNTRVLFGITYPAA